MQKWELITLFLSVALPLQQGGKDQADDGNLQLRKGLNVSYLAQVMTSSIEHEGSFPCVHHTITRVRTVM